MNSTDRSAVMRRLRKILALTKSGEPGEAAAALHQAKKLMHSHGLTERDIADSAIGEASIKLSGAEISVWEGALVNVITASLSVGVLIRGQTRVPGAGRRDNAEVIFVGEGPNAAIAQYAFAHLRKQLKASLDARIQGFLKDAGKTSRKVSIPARLRQEYARGWCAAVRSKVAALGASKPSEAVEDYCRRKQSGDSPAVVKSARGPGKEVASAFLAAGLTDGREAQIHKAVHGASGQLALAA